MDYIVFGKPLSQTQIKERYGISAKDVARCAERTCNSSYWIGYEIEQLIKARNKDVHR